jgi:hypothetical protein
MALFSLLGPILAFFTLFVIFARFLVRNLSLKFKG